MAGPDEAFLTQHRPIVNRAVMGGEGRLITVRGLDPDSTLRKLSLLRDAQGGPWLSARELATAAQLRQDWELAQIGQVPGSDWSAPPRGCAARGPSSAREAALGARSDARRRVEMRLARLAPLLRRAVENVCLQEIGLEQLEVAEGWPLRSGKVALKLGLAQIAELHATEARRASS